MRAALAALDALVARFPRLMGPASGVRLAKLLDDWTEEGDRGNHHGEDEAQ
jgi:hypothetical protein